MPDFSSFFIFDSSKIISIPRATRDITIFCLTNSSSGHHLQEETAKVFCLGNGRQYRMVERLFKATQSPRGSASINQGVRHGFGKNFRADVVGTGESGEQSVRRKQLEGADVQFAVATQRIVQAAFGFGEGRRIENDEVEMLAGPFRPAEKLKDVLLDPANREVIAGRVCFRGAKIFRAGFHAKDLAGSGTCTGQGKSTLAGETVEHAPPRGVGCDQFIVWKLIEVEPRFLGMQEIDLQFRARNLNFDFAR